MIAAKDLDRGGQVRDLLADLRALASPAGAGSATTPRG
jgi:hypothetical protein